MEYSKFCNIILGNDDYKNCEKLFLIDDIIFLSADSNYTILHLSNSKKLLFSRSLKLFEVILARYDFVRIHKKYLINLKHISLYDSCEGIVIMKNKQTVNVSRRKRIALELQMKRFKNSNSKISTFES